MTSEKNQFTFEEVLSGEIDHIQQARAAIGLERVAGASSGGAIGKAHAAQLCGLALSGGGIRSATFNLGVIQALAEGKRLRRFDYLSTVSGGGYIGSWLSALLRREANGDPRELEKLLAPAGADTQSADRAKVVEHPSIRFLRRYSNYLTPKSGLLSADSLAFAATYVRNLILNLMVLVTFLGAVLLIPVLLAALFRHINAAQDDLGVVGLAALALSLTAVFFCSANMARLRDESRADDPWYTRQGGIVFSIVIPVTAAAILFSRFMWNGGSAGSHWYASFALLYPLVWMAGWALERMIAPGQPTRLRSRVVPALEQFRKWLVTTRWMVLVPAAVVSAATSVALFLFISAHSGSWTTSQYSHWHLVTWGTPIILIVFGLSVTLYIGLMGDAYSERGREWWSRVGAWFTISVGCWSLLFAIAVYSGVVLDYVAQHAGPWLNKAIASGWLLATVGGVIAGRGNKHGSVKQAVLGKVAPYVFVIGLLMLLMECLRQAAFMYLESKDQLGAVVLQNVRDACVAEGFDASICLLEMATRYAPVELTFCTLLAISLLLSWRVDINLFSLHMMYRNRLIRCYLGASRSNRHPQPFTGFDPHDDLSFASLASTDKSQRPYHLVNAALNLVRGRQLAWQQRKAANFVFTPRFSGYLLTDPPQQATTALTEKLQAGCFRNSKDYSAKGYGVTLGTALAISGAAASPNMGAQSSPAMTFLLTVFNVRLGRWCGNPLHPRTWMNRGPAWGGKYLLLELFGLTDEITPFVYLSDGGHFENTAIYELVRRRCALIVVCDCGADPDYQFADLANAIQKCYTDFGIEIEISVDKLRPGGNARGEFSHAAIGEICYDKVDSGATNGKLILIKPCLNGDEPSDVRSYHARHVDFPQQPTTDQWFDETQFESYRKLGFHIGRKLVETMNAENAQK